MEKRTVAVASGEFNLLQAGGGYPLLLLHSLGTSNYLWEKSIPELARHFSVIAPDYLGHGQSGKPPREFTLPDHSNSLIELMDALGHAEFAVAGTSVGGLIGLDMASSWPDRVKYLVCNGTPGWEYESQRTARLAYISKSVGPDGLPLLEVVTGGRTDYTGREEELKRRKQDLQRAGRWFISTAWAIACYDPMSRAERVKCPTLILMGDQDYHMPTSYVLKDRVPGSQFSVIAGAGHLTPYDAPQEVVSAVRDFILATPKLRAAS